MSMEPVLQTYGLSKRYGSHIALDGLTLQLPQGKIIGLLGPNGSGKTTLLKICAGVLTPTVGQVGICGQPTCRTELTCRTARRSGISWTFSRPFTRISTGPERSRCSRP